MRMQISQANTLHHSWPAFLVFSGIGLTLFLVFLGPAETRTLSAPSLLLFWTVHVVLPLALLQGAQTIVSGCWVGTPRSPWPQILLAALIGAVAFTPVAFWMDALFGLNEDDAQGLVAVLDEFVNLAPPIILVWVALNASRLLRLPPLAHPEDSTPDMSPEFWERVPRALGRDLIALSAELHYTRVTTTEGDVLVLYPFGRAVEELADAPGMRVHRSHWVALNHVTGIDRRGQGAVVHLTGGLSLPVSRSYRKALTTASA